MTNHTATRSLAAGRAGLRIRIRGLQRQISDRAHAAADQDASALGWTVTVSTGRFGMGARTYRDPRFAGLADARLATPLAQGARRSA